MNELNLLILLALQLRLGLIVLIFQQQLESMLVNKKFMLNTCIIVGITYEIAIHDAEIKSYEYMLSAFILKI